MASKTMIETTADGATAESGSRPSWIRWPLILLGLAAIGWIWPYDPAGVPDRIFETGWLLGWLTILVMLGAVAGYVLKNRWSAILVPVALFVGGVVSWMQHDWGFNQPHWDDFLPFSAVALGVLLVTSGFPAGIACRVVAAESRPFGRGSDSIRLSAAVAGLLALFSITTLVVLPFPYLGGLLGFAAILAGIGVLQEGQPGRTERVLAILGMLVGGVAVIITLYMFLGVFQDFL